ncbi:hypothetical protein HJ588_04330 [Flexivirga sp. ID2601S]|uniref:Coenzyme Q-binding protein COQ10 START domain-containing protein n=1 Tax=Flexivirga aerilata TaxID=1656889 RepID=A0A849ANY0_9MICO|nr:SRPBCC family protein [Flexivirga aerilata]NNG38502.1 hypothetical protein [Flexivirga aerilata]
MPKITGVRDTARAQQLVQSDRRTVSDLFWDVRAWHEIWSGIDSVEVLYDDGVHQEFTMTVYRGGVTETVRTIRYRHPTGDIEFFTPECPPGMEQHSGYWMFHEVPGQPGTCEVLAGRQYTLTPDQRSFEQYENDRWFYQLSFTGRLHAILLSFAEHFAHEPAATNGHRYHRCDASIVAPVSAADVSAFLQVTENLPQWAAFFSTVEDMVDDRVRMRTVLGSTVLTRVEHPYEGLFIISSVTEIGEERALVTVHPLGDESILRFTMWMTDALVSARFRSQTDTIDQQRGTLVEELNRLADAAKLVGESPDSERAAA